MNNLKSEISTGKILSTFFNNLGIAWFSAGVIAPLFSPDFYPLEYIVIGMLGSFVSVFSAIILKNIK